MTDDVGTTYFSYRGPSPLDHSSASQANRNTLRSVHSQSIISDRGDNNDITTLAVRPYQSNGPDIPPPSQSVVLLSPPYPGYYHPSHPGHSFNSNGSDYLAPPYISFDSIAARESMDRYSAASPVKVHSDLSKGTETLRQCALLMSIVFLLVFGTAIFMAVYYGNYYSS